MDREKLLENSVALNMQLLFQRGVCYYWFIFNITTSVVRGAGLCKRTFIPACRMSGYVNTPIVFLSCCLFRDKYSLLYLSVVELLP